MAVLGRGSLGRGGDGSPRVWEVRARWRSVRACDLLRDRARVSRRFRKALAGGARSGRSSLEKAPDATSSEAEI
jgi:hypothetical protein